MIRAPIAITGQGAVCALGLGLDAIWAELAAGRDGIRVIERFSTETFGTHLGGLVPLPGVVGVDDALTTRAICVKYAVLAGREALTRAAVPRTAPRRIALVLGTSMGSHLGGLHEASAEVATALGLEGPVITISTACASSTNALGVGRDLLDDGQADVVLAGGADVLCPEIFAGFHALGLLSAGKCSPFSEQVGTTLGEGAGFLVLERADEAKRRGAPFVAGLTGYGLSCDGYHATSPEPTGAGVARALRSTLEDAGVAPAEVGYVNAHGTGTAANDPAEWQAITQVLGEQVAVSSTKSYLAHAQGAAGVLELICTLLAMEHGQVLPTLHFTKARRRGPVDPIADVRPRPMTFEHAVCTNSAFGGANAAVAISRHVTPRPAVEKRSIFISGQSSLSPKGGEGRGEGLTRLLPTADPRNLDPSSIDLTMAVAQSLQDANLKLSGAARERTGLFVGTTNASPASWEEFRASVRERGIAKASAPAFTRLVLNAAAGAASRLLGLRGPTTTLTTGEGSGLLALVLAAIHLESRTDVDRLVVAAVDELDAQRPTQGEGAASLVLTTLQNEGAVRLAGWGLAGPKALDEAIARACEEVRPLSPTLSPLHGERERVASGSLSLCAEQVRALRLAPGQFLITDVSAAASCAVVLERSPA